jgi:NAD(P)H dehydrogenase (quinone)
MGCNAMSEKIQSIARKPRIAIAGATGRVGSTLTSLLASDPVELVALTRRPDAAQLPSGVTLAAIDFDQPKTLVEAPSWRRSAVRFAWHIATASGQ